VPKNYNMPKKGQMGGMMQQMQRLQEQLMRTQEQLAEETLTHSAGGGAIKITITGDQRIQAVEIDPELLKDSDVEMLQDLILASVNGALDASRALAAERLGPLSGGLPF
jgi:DNA-binding YbaB/EbfC family protein